MTVTLELVGDTLFRDWDTGETYEPGESYDFDDEERAAEKLAHPSGKWQRVSEDATGDENLDNEDAFTDLEGVGEAKAEDLRADGYVTFDDLRDATEADLAETVGEGDAASIKEQL